MKCFNHPESNVVAVCSHCGRGLCAACAIAVANDRIACANRCEHFVEAMNDGDLLSPNQKKRLLILFGVIGLLGCVSWVFGELDSRFHWTYYAIVFQCMISIVVMPICFIGTYFLQIALNAWEHAKRPKRLEKPR